MAQNAPREILDLILAEFQMGHPRSVERRTVAACGLVCKHWLPSSRYILFGDVEFDDRALRTFFNVVGNSLFPILNSIRSISLWLEGTALDEALERLGPLPQVTALRVRAIHFQNPAFLARTFPTISALIFERSSTVLEPAFTTSPLPPLSSILRVVSLFPSLESLTLRWMFKDRFAKVSTSSGSEPDVTGPYPPLWKSLTLAANNSEELFSAIMSLDVIPVLSSLSVRGIPREDTALKNYLSHVGSALQYLRLQSAGFQSFDHHGLSLSLPDVNYKQSPSSTDTTPTGLRYSTDLRRLDLVFSGYADVGSTVLSAILHVRSRNLTRLDVIDDYGTNSIMANKWRLLDTKLADEQFATLQVINIQIKSPSLAPRISQLMPSCEERGILKFRDVAWGRRCY
ncbi:hypothetical protein DFH06DRAFT_1479277 [Mycena polygramma]|nr:hypothetical protein DFH06DRAFT_1479277 [Mycena polygramma]